MLMSESQMEVGCPGTWGLELLTLNPGSKDTPKTCPTHNPNLPHPAPAQGPIILSQEASGNNDNDDIK